jgi:hypothetical protein
LLLFLFLSGCARLQTLRVVDESGQPLGGIAVERLEGSLEFDPVPGFLRDNLSPVEKLTSDSAGSVAFKQSGKQFMVNPHSNNQAYVTASWSGATVCYPGDPHAQEIPIRRVNGVVEIPLPGQRGVAGGRPAAGREERTDAASARQAGVQPPGKPPRTDLLGSESSDDFSALGSRSADH